VHRWILGFGTWCAALLLGTALFHALGAGNLAPPPLDPSDWGPWIAGRDALTGTMALLRLVVLGLCWYLVGVTSIGTVARLLRAARFVRLADAVTLPIVRRLLQQTLGVALATTMITASAAPSLAVPATSVGQIAAGRDGDGAPVDAAHGPLPFGATARAPIPPWRGLGTARPAQERHGDLPEVTLRGLPPPPSDEPLLLPWRIAAAPGPGDPDAPAAGEGAASPSEVPTGEEDAGVPSVLLRDAATGRTSHTVRSGESLWRIASQRLELAIGRSPTDAELVPYWRELIEANRDRLPDRDDPDLILPGQKLLLPQPAAP